MSYIKKAKESLANLNPEGSDFEKNLTATVYYLKAAAKKVRLSNAERQSLTNSINRADSVMAAVMDKEIDNKEAYESLASLPDVLERISEAEKPVVVKTEVTAAIDKASPVILKDLSDLANYRSRLSSINKTIKRYEGVDYNEELDRKKETEWLDHTRKEGEYESALTEDAKKQKATIEKHIENLPSESSLKTKVEKNGWTWMKAPLLVVFKKSPSTAGITRSRLTFENLTMGHHLSERIRGESGRLGTIIEDQILLVFPTSLISNQEEFEADKEIAIHTLSNRLGEMEALSKSPMGKTRLSRATDTDRLDFSVSSPPEEPKKPDAPSPLTKKDQDDPKKVRAFAKAKRAYDKEVKAYEPKLEEYKKKYKEYQKQQKAKQKAIDNVKKRETKALKVSRDDYFLSQSYPGLAFVWVMRSATLNALMPMQYVSVDFPSLHKDFEQKVSPVVGEQLRNIRSTQDLLETHLDNLTQSLKQNAALLDNMQRMYNEKATQLRRMKRNDRMYNTMQATLAAITIQMNKMKDGIESLKKQIPGIKDQIESLEKDTKEMIRNKG